MSESTSPAAILEEAERLLQGITPGEWHVAICADEFGIVPGRANVEAGAIDVADDVADADAAFIAASPRLVRDLLAYARQVEAERDEAREKLAEKEDFIGQQDDAIGRLQVHAAVASSWQQRAEVAEARLAHLEAGLAQIEERVERQHATAREYRHRPKDWDAGYGTAHQHCADALAEVLTALGSR